MSTNATTGLLVKSASPTSGGKKIEYGYVYDIILDNDNEYIKKNKDHGSDYIGCILYANSLDTVNSLNNLTLAYPFDKNFKSLPIKNEKVEIYDSAGGFSLYRRVDPEYTPNVANTSNTLFNSNKNRSSNDSTIQSYKEVSATNIANTNSNNDTSLSGYGKYFGITKIHKLKLYEGDLLIESRFGQSIRFSAYNNSKNKFSPTLIIRNRENNYDFVGKDVLESIEENVNSDGSIISMSSNEYQLNFVPGVVDKNGKGNMKTLPSSFQDYPTKLIGDQLLLSSGRVIISSKSGEMIFYSKKNYGFISDGTFSIDNGGGIEVSVGKDINIATNDNDFAIHTGNGSIFLGDTDLEPIVKGQQLVNFLGDLIDAIVEQQYLTPSGPTKIGPENVQTFSSLKTKLNVILSKLNQTS